MKLVQPRPGEGWDRLLMTPKFNGGDHIPEELRQSIDAALSQVDTIGVLHDDTPSIIFTFQTVGHEDGTEESIVHWAADGRIPAPVSCDLVTEVARQHPTRRYLAFCRRPGLVRLLGARGWWVQSHEDDPFMALMVCQGAALTARH